MTTDHFLRVLNYGNYRLRDELLAVTVGLASDAVTSEEFEERVQQLAAQVPR